MIVRILFGVGMVWLGAAVLIDGLIVEGRLRVQLSREAAAGLLLILSGLIYAIGFATETIPLPEEGEDALVSKQWIWYLATVGIATAAAIRTVGLLDSFS